MKKLPVKILGILGFILLIPSIILNIFLYQKAKSLGSGILVLEVLDGDTLLLEREVRLRLREIDAPALENCGGKQAKEVLTGLVKGKRVVLKEQIIDNWGRPMALIYVGDTLINLEMIKSGWARHHSDKTTQQKIMQQAYEEIQKEEKGIFSSLCHQKENLENPKCNIKANIDKNSDRRNYYFPGCPQYNTTIVELDTGEQWFCTEKEAQAAGFTRAKNCP